MSMMVSVQSVAYISTPCPEKGNNIVLYITFTNLNMPLYRHVPLLLPVLFLLGGRFFDRGDTATDQGEI